MCGGGKGQSTTTQNQTQQYTPSPYISAAGQAALLSATSASQQPFQQPQAPVAGFTPFQEQYFNAIQGVQGMAQPYFNTGLGLLQGSAAPISDNDVANYYNPMSQNVFAAMKDLYGQQMGETTRGLTGQAGGVGADRIAVGQSELARQQQLGQGQVAASLWQQALAGAQQQKQMMAGAGYGIANIGSAAQSAQLQGIGALGAAGNQQQQLAQAQLNAPYQQQLAQIAYPFQTAQYLAGITGGLAPALGGTTYGTGSGTYTPPQPSPFSQALGAGVAGIGLYNAFPGTSAGFGDTTPYGSTYGAPSGSYGSYGGISYPTFRRGGRLAYQGGGNLPGSPFVSDQPEVGAKDIIPKIDLPTGGSGMQYAAKMDLSPKQPSSGGGKGSGGIGDVAKIASAVAPFLLARGGGVSPFDIGQPMQEGGDTDNPFAVDQPHLTLSDVLSKAQNYYAPKVSGVLEAGQSDDPIRGRLSGLFGGPKSAPAAVTPAEPNVFAPAMPTSRPQEASLTDPSASLSDVYRGGHSELGKAYGPQVASAIMGNLGVESPGLDPAESHDQGTGLGIAGWRNERRDALYDFAGKNGLDPIDRRTQLAFLQHEIQTNPQYADMVKRMQAAGSPAEAARIFRTEFERPAGTTQGRPLGLDQAQRLATQFHSGNFENAGAGAGAGAGPARSMVADYQPAMDRYLAQGREPLDWGQRMVRSPWLSLVGAGAAMMSTPGPIGSVIGAGLSAGAQTLAGQRKALDSEELLNLKSDMLMERADQHLREYQRKSDYADIRTRIAEEREKRLGEKETRIKESAPIAYKDALKEARENNPGLVGNPQALHQAAIQIMQSDPSRASVNVTPVDTIRKFKSGTFKKVKDGPDSDSSTWSKVGT
jgi:hypothetical protein